MVAGHEIAVLHHNVAGDDPLAGETATPPYHHIGLDVDDFKAAFVMARDRGLLDDALGPRVRELIDGSAQMHLRDPVGKLVEVDWPDASKLDREVVEEIALLADEHPQSDEARRARLYLAPAAPWRPRHRANILVDLSRPDNVLRLDAGGVRFARLWFP